jgi:hypothetical protein
MGYEMSNLYRGPAIDASTFWFDLIFGVLTPLSTIFQLYNGDQF